MSNGCGPESWSHVWWKRVLKYIFFGWMFDPICDKHDDAYFIGGDDKDRFKADNEMAWDMIKHVVKALHIFLIGSWIWIPMYILVRARGHKHFTFR